MLNPYWERVYDPKDFEMWKRLEGTAPPVIYQFQKQILYGLLEKYYRTNKGNVLHPDNPKYPAAFLEMLTRTMDELARAVAARDSKSEESWYEQRDKEEDLGAKLTREDDLKRDASLRKISLRKDVDFGRFWISPRGEEYNPPSTLSHGAWMEFHKNLLSPEERGLCGTPYFLPTLLSDGWIRISEHFIQIHSQKELPRVIEFLKKHTTKAQQNLQCFLVTSEPEDMEGYSIGDIISGRMRKMLAAMEDPSSPVPNPLRRNYDYSSELGGPEWQNRVKNYRKLITEKAATKAGREMNHGQNNS